MGFRRPERSTNRWPSWAFVRTPARPHIWGARTPARFLFEIGTGYVAGWGVFVAILGKPCSQIVVNRPLTVFNLISDGRGLYSHEEQ